MRLRSKITVPFLTISLIPFLLMSVITYYAASAVRHKTLGFYFQSLAQQTVKNIDFYLYKELQMIRSWTKLDLMQEVSIGDLEGNISSFLKNMQKEHDDFNFLDVLNSSGTVIASTSSLSGKSLTHEKFFTQAVAGAPYVGDIQFDAQSRTANVVFAFPIRSQYGPEKETLGVLRVIWKAEQVSKVLMEIFSEGGELFTGDLLVIRKDGLVIAANRSAAEMIFKTNLLDKKFQAARFIQEQREGYLIGKAPIKQDDDDYLIGYSYSKGYKDFKGFGWGVLVIQNTKSVFQPIYQFRSVILGAGLLIIIVAILISLKVSNDVVWPVLQIASVAKEVAKGNLETQVGYSSGDEVGALAKIFNGMVSDLKEQRRQLASEHEQLKESEARMGTIIKDVIESIVVIDQHGIIQLFNPAAEKIFGYTAEEVMGRNVSMLMPSPYKEEHDSYIANYLRTGQTKVIGIGREVVGQHKSGAIFPMELRVSEVIVGQGRRLFIGVTRDITERRQAEDILKKAIVMKDEFISTVSHELRTPLSIVKEGLSLLRRERVGGLSGQQKEVVAMTAENIDRLSVLIDDILDVSKLEAGRMTLSKEPVNVVDLIKENCRGWFLQADTKKIRMRLKAAAEVIILAIDKTRFIQIFSNLLSNAVKFTPEGGTIDIVVEEMEDKVKFAVRDTGPGIDPGNIPKLFEKFQQFSRTYGPGRQGTGLGLAITKSLVELHGGYSGVESEVGKGSTFFFTIPKGGSHLNETLEDQS